MSTLYHAGHALPPGTAAPTSREPRPHRGGAEHPTLTALRAAMPDAVQRAEVCWGDTIVYLARHRVAEVLRWLRDDPAAQYEYLVDITAVEYREAGRPLEVVWQLRSLAFRRFLRLKLELDATRPLEVPSAYDVWRSADWLERECYDMFGITFTGHPDLRRILMWESYAEGYPLRKDFPLRGRFSRAEQLSQALRANPEAHYSMAELSIAEAYGDITPEMRARLDAGAQVGE